VVDSWGAEEVGEVVGAASAEFVARVIEARI
jgi:hypothetical protein